MKAVGRPRQSLLIENKENYVVVVANGRIFYSWSITGLVNFWLCVTYSFSRSRRLG